MQGWRKILFGSIFMGCATFLTYTAILNKVDLLGLSTVIGAMAVGVGTVIYGNIKEHQAKASKPE